MWMHEIGTGKIEDGGLPTKSGQVPPAATAAGETLAAESKGA